MDRTIYGLLSDSDSDSDDEVPAFRSAKPAAKKDRDWGRIIRELLSDSDSDDEAHIVGRRSYTSTGPNRSNSNPRQISPAPFTGSDESESVIELLGSDDEVLKPPTPNNADSNQSEVPPSASLSAKFVAKKHRGRVTPFTDSSASYTDGDESEESLTAGRLAKPAAKKHRGRVSPSTESTTALNSDGDDQELTASHHTAKPAASNSIRKSVARNSATASESDSEDEEQEPTGCKNSIGLNAENKEEQEEPRRRQSRRARKQTDIAARNLHHNYIEPPEKRRKKNVEGSSQKNMHPKNLRNSKEPEFVVDEVLDRRITADCNGDYHIEYKLSWVGYSQDENSWEPPENMSEDVLMKAFSKFPTDDEATEDGYVYQESDLERCTAYYDVWKEENPKETDHIYFEVQTDSRVHLRIGMWCKPLDNDDQRLLIVCLDEENMVAICLVFISRTNTILKKNHYVKKDERQEDKNDTQQTQRPHNKIEYMRLIRNMFSSSNDGKNDNRNDDRNDDKNDDKVKYMYNKAISVPIDDLCKRHRRCKGSVQTSQWKYSETSEHEFTIESNKDKEVSWVYAQLPRKPKALVLCGGTGVGMSCGYEEMDAAWQVEEDETKAIFLEALKAEGQEVHTESIQSFLNKLKKGQRKFLNKEVVDHIHLSAPLRGKARDDAIAKSFVEYVEFLKPKTGMYDSSVDLLHPENIEIFETMIRSLHRLNYQIRSMILDASDYGDSIKTKRVVIFVSEETIPLPKRPMATHGEGLNEKSTVGDALYLLEDKPPDSAIKVDGETIYNHDPPSNNVPTDEECEEFGLEANCPQSYAPTDEECEELALNPHKPAPDITSKNRPIHPNKERFLTIRELLCLKSFDRKCKLFGSEQEMLEVVSGAMPVRMAEKIARSIECSYGFS